MSFKENYISPDNVNNPSLVCYKPHLTGFFNFNIMQEIWKDIPGYEGYYQASNYGKIRNSQLHILSSRVGNAGYKMTSLQVSGKRKLWLVHRLICLTFIANNENKDFVNHKDCDKLNNNYNNLEWCTHSENMRHAYANGLYDEAIEKRRITTGKMGRKYASINREMHIKHGFSTGIPIVKLSLDNIPLKIYSSAKEAKRDTKAHNILGCLKKQLKTSAGYKWEYVSEWTGS